MALEAACLRLLVDRDDLLSDLLEKLKGVRHGSLGAEAIDPVREGHWRKSTGVATAPSTS